MQLDSDDVAEVPKRPWGEVVQRDDAAAPVELHSRTRSVAVVVEQEALSRVHFQAPQALGVQMPGSRTNLDRHITARGIDAFYVHLWASRPRGII